MLCFINFALSTSTVHCLTAAFKTPSDGEMGVGLSHLQCYSIYLTGDFSISFTQEGSTFQSNCYFEYHYCYTTSISVHP